MKILISNDDGINASGIRVLAEHLQKFGELDIVAPDRNRSGASNSLSLTRPLRVQHLDENRIAVEGTPTDCVHLATTGLFEYQHDMVVSGINQGANLGDDVFYSGTVAAAMEGRFLGLPAMAVSCVSDLPQHYETAAIVVCKIIEKLAKNPLPQNTILNINVPDVPYNELEGLSITRLGTRHQAEPTIKQTDPRGNKIYWIGPPGPQQDAGPGTDFYAVKNNQASITPLHLDLTDYKAFDSLTPWMTDIVLRD